MTIEIPLNSKRYPGLFALVDDQDYELVSQYRWYPAKRYRTFYALANVKVDGKRTTLLMHKLISGYKQTDHEDRNGLNNQRHNLRSADTSQNNANKVKWRGAYTSPHKGVGWHRRDGKWRARIKVNGNVKYLGLFTDELEAAKAYDQAAIAAFGPFAVLNFPATTELLIAA